MKTKQKGKTTRFLTCSPKKKENIEALSPIGLPSASNSTSIFCPAGNAVSFLQYTSPLVFLMMPKGHI